MRSSSRTALAKALRSRYWRRADAEIVLAAWSASRESARAFARRRGLSPERLLRWKQRLAAPELPHFHPVEIVTGPRPHGQADKRDLLELVLRDGRRVSVPAAFDAEDLRRLVEAVESWSC